MVTTRRSRRLWFELALLGLIVVLVLAARYSAAATRQLLGNMELRFLDARFLARGPRPPQDVQALAHRVTIVALDDTATRRFKYPLPRTVHAKLVQQLKKAGARAIIFDILFVDPDHENPDDDLTFANACAAAGNVFLPFDDASAQPAPDDVLKRVESRLAYPVPAPRTAQAPRVRPPVAPLLAAIRGGGHVATKADSDSKFRSAILLMESGAVYPHVALDAVVRTVWNLTPQNKTAAGPRLSNGYFEIGKGANTHRIGPLEERPLREFDAAGNAIERLGTAWTLPLNFIGGHEVMQELTVSYTDVLDGRVDDRLRDRIVIIGETATGTPDLRPGPFDRQKVFFGVETNATFIANLLENNFLKHAPQWWAVLATLGCALVAGFSAVGLRPASAFIVSAMAGVLYAIVAVLVFASNNLVLEMTAPLLAIFVCYTALTAYRLVFSDREAREYALALRETEEILGLHVNPRIAQELRDNPETRIAMQIGTRREVTVLFSDIRSFTAWSDNQTPEEVKSRLDEYFPTMCEIASDDYDGYIDKFIGDALMVVWNAHKEHPDHAERAVRAALSMQRALDMLNDGWRKQKQQEFRIGIGIATGPVVFGTFGSPRHKLMPTAIGDTVNLASRLETTTKETGSAIIISQATYEAIKDIVEVKPLGNTPIRGKSDTQAIYEVLALRKVELES